MVILPQKRTIFLVVFAGILFSGCKWDTTGSSLESFDYRLRDIWVATEDPPQRPPWETPWETGQLKITNNTITITGYVRPFNSGYTKDFPFDGYSEKTSSDGKRDIGTLCIEIIGGPKIVYYELLHATNGDILAVGTGSSQEQFRRKQ